MYPAGYLLFALGVGLGVGLGMAWGAFSFRRWVRNEVREEAKRTFTALIGHAQDVAAVKLATEVPPSTLREMAMTLGKLQSELQDARDRVTHVMDNGGNWDDTAEQRALYKKKERPAKKH